jgi:hypothetical protein
MPLAKTTPQEACKVVEDTLKIYYENVSVTAVECPDLTSWGLASQGICGNGTIFDIGGVPLMFNPNMQGSVFDIPRVMTECGVSSGRRLITGAGAGALTQGVGNAEWSGNCLVVDGVTTTNRSLTAWIPNMNKLPRPYITCPCPQGSCMCGCLANVFVSQGTHKESVMKVQVSGRKKGKARPGDWHETELNRLVRLAMQKKARAPHEAFGLGGVVRVTGKSQMVHIMPPYFPLEGARPSPTPLLTIKGWGEVFFETSKPLICLPVLLSSDGGHTDLGLRVEHTHFYSEDTSLAGHYHFDMTDDISCEGYYSFASEVIKVDPNPGSKL